MPFDLRPPLGEVQTQMFRRIINIPMGIHRASFIHDLKDLATCLWTSLDEDSRAEALREATVCLELMNSDSYPSRLQLSEPFLSTVRLMSDAIRFTGQDRITFVQIEVLLNLIRDLLSPVMTLDDFHICRDLIRKSGLRTIPAIPGLSLLYNQEAAQAEQDDAD